MKALIFFAICLASVNITYSQDNPPGDSPYKPFYLSFNMRTNLTESSDVGFGTLVSGGYLFSENFSIRLTTGYLTSHVKETDYYNFNYDFNYESYVKTTTYIGARTIQTIPIDLSLRYTIPLTGFKPYALFKAGYELLVKESDFEFYEQYTVEKTGESIGKEDLSSNTSWNPSASNNAFVYGFGLGVLIPIDKQINLDISYICTEAGVAPLIHSFGIGIDFGF